MNRSVLSSRQNRDSVSNWWQTAVVWYVLTPQCCSGDT